MLSKLLTCLTFIALTAGPALALDPPKGLPILTITGNISEANSGPFNVGIDKFTASQDESFDKAARLDLGMLLALPQHEVTVNRPDWPIPFILTGPRLMDVLALAGANPKGSLKVTALDGWTTEIPVQALKSKDWILGIRDQKGFLALGQRGPAWIVFTPFDPKGNATEEEDGQWPWAVYYIRVD